MSLQSTQEITPPIDYNCGGSIRLQLIRYLLSCSGSESFFEDRPFLMYSLAIFSYPVDEWRWRVAEMLVQFMKDALDVRLLGVVLEPRRWKERSEPIHNMG